MARCLIIGCGCRGRALARELSAGGHAVRGTTRDHHAVAKIADAGAEPYVGDPDRIATLAPALEHVSVVCVLLSCARGSADQLAALHGSRLEMLLARAIDTTVRAVVYDAAGSVDAALLHRGAEIVRAACERSLLEHAVLETDVNDHQQWLREATAAVERMLGLRWR